MRKTTRFSVRRSCVARPTPALRGWCFGFRVFQAREAADLALAPLHSLLAIGATPCDPPSCLPDALGCGLSPLFSRFSSQAMRHAERQVRLFLKKRALASQYAMFQRYSASRGKFHEKRVSLSCASGSGASRAPPGSALRLPSSNCRERAGRDGSRLQQSDQGTPARRRYAA